MKEEGGQGTPFPLDPKEPTTVAIFLPGRERNFCPFSSSLSPSLSDPLLQQGAALLFHSPFQRPEVVATGEKEGCMVGCRSFCLSSSTVLPSRNTISHSRQNGTYGESTSS